jgi:hypothetical protein
LLGFFDAPPPQQEQPGPWLLRLGLSALRSLVSCALRVSAETVPSRGVASKMRFELAWQTGQVWGLLKSEIRAKASNGPQLTHS